MVVLVKKTMVRKGMSVCVAILILLTQACGPSATASKELQAGDVHHVVLCWLKDPGNDLQIKTIIDQTQGFSSEPGVVSIVAGTSLESSRPVVDDSFDIGIVMAFESRKHWQLT